MKDVQATGEALAYKREQTLSTQTMNSLTFFPLLSGSFLPTRIRIHPIKITGCHKSNQTKKKLNATSKEIKPSEG